MGPLVQKCGQAQKGHLDPAPQYLGLNWKPGRRELESPGGSFAHMSGERGELLAGTQSLPAWTSVCRLSVQASGASSQCSGQALGQASREEPSRAVSFLWPRLRCHIALHVSYPVLYEHTYFVCRCVCIAYCLITNLVAQNQKHLSQIVPQGQQSSSCVVLAQGFLWGYSPMAGATVILTRRC